MGQVQFFRVARRRVRLSANIYAMSVDTSLDLAAPGTLVLLGAGASVGAGFPTSIDLHQMLLDRLDAIYGNLARLVFSSNENVDPERLFRVMEFLGALETRNGSFDTALGNEAGDIAALVETWHRDVADYLNSRRVAVQGSPLQRTIQQLFRALVEIFSINAPPVDPRFDYLFELASSMRGQTIVTLNYDDALEHMPGRALTFRIDSNPYPELTQAAESLHPLTRPLRLVKLHGSLDWRRNDSTGDVQSMAPGFSFHYNNEAWDGHTPGVIFGAGNKLRPDGPYLALYQEFLVALSEAHQVVVIGYSFRDAHVNEALRRWVVEQAADGDLLRVGWLERALPTEVERWVDGRQLDVEVVAGPAEQMMAALVAPRPRLMGRP